MNYYELYLISRLCGFTKSEAEAVVKHFKNNNINNI